MKVGNLICDSGGDGSIGIIIEFTERMDPNRGAKLSIFWNNAPIENMIVYPHIQYYGPDRKKSVEWILPNSLKVVQ
jgi:hypothetical protein